MNNDLISRSALKEDFKSRLARCNEWIEKAKDKETKIRADATKHFICEVIMTIDNAPTIIPSLKLENITEDDIEKFKMIWQRATSKGLPLISEDVLYREDTCDRKSHCTDYEYWHCIGCNGCKRREADNER